MPSKGNIIPSGYGPFLDALKDHICRTQVKTAVAVNRDLIALYWHIGKSIVDRQRAEGWGKSIVEQLSIDLRREFPGTTGFSPQNIWKMRSIYLAWTEDTANLSQVVRDLDASGMPEAVAEIPWGHNTELVARVKDPVVRLWYARAAREYGWSRAVLVHQIETNLYRRQGQAITNFPATLPPADSDLARETLKDPYIFDFLSVGAEARERELETALLAHIRDFLIELGAGFAFLGNQYHLAVGEQDFYIDLLFYHTRLRRYIVIDLKMGAFEPEFAGKMSFYLSAVDDLLRHDQDERSIGIILCKGRDQVVAEYALRDIRKPMGVATYRLTEALPEALREDLPEIERLEAELREAPGE